MEESKKKSLKWLWIVIAVAVVVALGVWCIVNAINNPKINMVPIKNDQGEVIGENPVEVETVRNILNFNTTFVLFAIAFVVLGAGYLLGGINIKGVTLGTAGVFLVAILVGYLCTLVPANAGVFSGFHLIYQYYNNCLKCFYHKDFEPFLQHFSCFYFLFLQNQQAHKLCG